MVTGVSGQVSHTPATEWDSKGRSVQEGPELGVAFIASCSDHQPASLSWPCTVEAYFNSASFAVRFQISPFLSSRAASAVGSCM